MLPHIQVPPPQPDESLHSLLIAAYRLSGHTNFHDFTELIFRIPSDGRGWSWRYKFISDYLDPCRKTGWALLQGTLQLPYLVPFMPSEAVRRGVNRLDGPCRTDAAALNPGWNTHNKGPLNYCPICTAASLRRLGRSFWLRSHQLEGVNVCWRHAVRLIQVPQRRSAPLLPHEFEDQKITYSFNKPDIWLAVQARELLIACHGPTRPEDRKEVYRKRAVRLGYGSLGRIDCDAIARHLARRFERSFLERVIGGADRRRLAGIVHSIISGQEPGIRPNSHLLCIEALFGDQRFFFQNLKLMAARDSRVVHSPDASIDRSSGSMLVHRSIFLQELKAHGRDVMVHLKDRYPLTHAWILKHALSWSRRKLAELIPHGPARTATLRAAARERSALVESERDRQRRAMSAIGGPAFDETTIPIHSAASEEVFEDLAGELMIRPSQVPPNCEWSSMS